MMVPFLLYQKNWYVRIIFRTEVLKLIIQNQNNNINIIIMIRRVLSSVNHFKGISFSNKATFFGQRDFDASKDYYLTLGVSKNASESEIKQSYYKLAKLHHPDHAKGQDTKIKQINQAYQVLSDSNKRKQYDQSRTFGTFTQNMGQKAQSGQYQYSSYQNVYSQMSPEEQQQVRQRVRVLLRNIALFSVGTIFLWILLTRRPAGVYSEYNGQLIPVTPQQYNSMMGATQPQFVAPIQQPVSAYGSPYSYNPNPNSNLNPPQGGFHQQYYPARNQNPYQPGYIQSNYTAQ